MFEQAGCAGQLCVQSLDGTQEVAVEAGRPAVSASVSVKSGSLVGVIRNEIGVIEYPDGRGYAAAVFAQAHRPWQNDAAINVAIGAAAAAAIGMLHD
jgi:hypothetical protein